MYNAARKAEVLDKFGILAPRIMEELIKESIIISFLRPSPSASLWLPYHANCLTQTHLGGVVRITHFACDNVIMHAQIFVKMQTGPYCN